MGLLIAIIIVTYIIHYSFKQNCRHYENEFKKIEIVEKDGKITYREKLQCKKCGKYQIYGG